MQNKSLIVVNPYKNKLEGSIFIRRLKIICKVCLVVWLQDSRAQKNSTVEKSLSTHGSQKAERKGKNQAQ